MLTQRAVVANLKQLGQCAHRGEPGARSLVVGPMLHAGVVWSTLAPLSWGASLVIVDDFDAAEVVRILSEERIDYASLVPTVLHTILSAVPDVAERQYPSLRLINSGSSPISEQTLLGARAAFRCEVVHALRPDGEHGGAQHDGARRLRARPAGPAGAAALGGAGAARDRAADRGRARARRCRPARPARSWRAGRN